MELFLHIGSHKAGSTSIQTFLENNKQYFDKSGCAVPDFLNYMDHWKIAAWASYPRDADYYTDVLRAFTKEELKLHSESFDKAIKESIQEKKRKRYKKFIISSESLYSGCSNPVTIQKIADCLMPHFDKVTLLFYYRSQVKLIKSAYAQLVKGPSLSCISYEDFVMNNYTNETFDYFSQLNKWADIFGKHNIKVAEISKSSNLFGKNLIKNFLSKVYESVEDYDLDVSQHANNPSPNYGTLNLIRKLNAAVSKGPFKLNYNSKLVRGLHYLTKKIPIQESFPTEFDAKVEEYFLLSNKLLVEEYASTYKDKM